MKHKSFVAKNSPVVVLVRPQLAENMGMVARAMMNCGLSELRLVNPKQDPLDQSAISSASGAQSILEQAKIFQNLNLAIEDINFVFATTARVRDMTKRIYTPDIAIKKTNQILISKQKVAFIFGPERTGLENDDLCCADALIRIPLNPIHPSLNLAQAVLLLGWSWWKSYQQDTAIIEKGSSKLATKKELQCFFDFLIQTLNKTDYFHWPEKRVRMEHNIQNIFTRTDLTSAEIKTLYRLIHKLSE